LKPLPGYVEGGDEFVNDNGVNAYEPEFWAVKNVLPAVLASALLGIQGWRRIAPAHTADLSAGTPGTRV